MPSKSVNNDTTVIFFRVPNRLLKRIDEAAARERRTRANYLYALTSLALEGSQPAHTPGGKRGYPSDVLT